MNRLHIRATVLECQPLRYTPAGVPVLEMLLDHESEVAEAGGRRKVALTMPAVAMGDLAHMLGGTALGTALHIEGFLAPTRKGSSRLRLHMQHAAPVASAHDAESGRAG